MWQIGDERTVDLINILKVICSSCGFKIQDNPIKHKNRDKYCPKCRTAYRKSGISWKPNLHWIKERLLRREKRRIDKQIQEFRRIERSIYNRTGELPSTNEVFYEWSLKIGDEDAKKIKWEKLRNKVRKT